MRGVGSLQPTPRHPPRPCHGRGDATVLQKAIIPVGWTGSPYPGGARGLLPEMLPVMGLPAIHHVVEEAVESGTEEIFLVGGPALGPVQAYFRSGGANAGPQDGHSGGVHLSPWAGEDGVPSLRRLLAHCELHFVEATQPANVGLGHLLWDARNAIAGSPFALLRADVLIDADRPCLTQLVPHFRGAALLAVHPGDHSDTDPLPLVQTHAADDHRVTDLVSEDPGDRHRMRLALTGRDILPGEFLDALDEVPTGPGDVISALRLMAHTRPVYCQRYFGTPFALRTARGLLRANLALASRNGLAAMSAAPWVVL